LRPETAMRFLYRAQKNVVNSQNVMCHVREIVDKLLAHNRKGCIRSA
jgi:hypothetical protein